MEKVVQVGQEQTARSLIEVERVDGRSRIISCLSVNPLKILTPRGQADHAAAVLSSYGGGMVEGDRIELTVRCGAGATLYLGTQAYTKAYKSPAGLASRQSIDGRLAARACVVALPDPVVPYADSVFCQEQAWDLAGGALLMLQDGFTGGRGAHGERFGYSRYVSSIDIRLNGHLVLAERFSSEPSRLPPVWAGVLGPYMATANVFIVGEPDDQRFTAVVETLTEQLEPRVHGSVQGTAVAGGSELVLSVARAKPGLFIIRALGRSVAALDPLQKALSAAAALPEVLGHDPLARKY